MNEQEHHDQFYLHEAPRILHSPLFLNYQQKIKNYLEKEGLESKSSRVLSLGSGIGTLEVEMAPAVNELVGVEISSVAVSSALEHAKNSGLRNIRFESGDILRMDFQSASF